MFNRIRPFVIIAVLLIAIAFPGSVNGEQVQYPTELNDLPVIYVQTQANTYSLPEGKIILTLLDISSQTTEESCTKANWDEFLLNNPLPKDWSIEVYGGIGASKEEWLKNHDDYNREFLENGPIVLNSPQSTLNSGSAILTADHTYAIIRDTDPSSQTVQGIDARWSAPTVGSDQTKYSALLVNGWTNTDYFLQSGQVFSSGTGWNVWADTTTNYVAQHFSLPYVIGHVYEFSVWYSSAGYWAMDCLDRTSWVYNYYYEHSATGTRLKSNNSTSVFFENWNTNSWWYVGFTNPIAVYTAKDYVSQWKAWNGQSIIILDKNGNQLPNNNIITGSLVSYGWAYFNLMYMPYVN